MTRVVRIQNMEQEGSHKTLIVALHTIAGKPSEMKVDPQREIQIAIHDGAPMISIGKQHISEDEMPSDTVIAQARSASGLQERIDLLEAENQQARADKDQLATEVERLTRAAAEHKPEGTDLTAKELEELRSNHTTLAEAYDKRFEEMKTAEARNLELSSQLAKLAEQGKVVGAGSQSEGAQPGSEHSHTPEPTITAAPELIEEAGRRGVEVEDGALKDDVRTALREDEEKRLNKLTKAELQAEAEQRDVQLDGNETKADLVDKLMKLA